MEDLDSFFRRFGHKIHSDVFDFRKFWGDYTFCGWTKTDREKDIVVYWSLVEVVNFVCNLTKYEVIFGWEKSIW